MPLSTVHAVHVPAAHSVGPSFVARMPLVNHGYAYVGHRAAARREDVADVPLEKRLNVAGAAVAVVPIEVGDRHVRLRLVERPQPAGWRRMPATWSVHVTLIEPSALSFGASQPPRTSSAAEDLVVRRRSAGARRRGGALVRRRCGGARVPPPIAAARARVCPTKARRGLGSVHPDAAGGDGHPACRSLAAPSSAPPRPGGRGVQRRAHPAEFGRPADARVMAGPEPAHTGADTDVPKTGV